MIKTNKYSVENISSESLGTLTVSEFLLCNPLSYPYFQITTLRQMRNQRMHKH